MDENTKIALERQNPWWFGKPFDTGIDRLQWYPKLMKYLNTEEILLLTGARRTGKSTLAYQLIQKLLDSHIPAESVLFINLDEPLFQSRSKDPVFLTELIESYLALKKPGRLYLFIDEIQNYDYWVQTVKTMFDTVKNVKFILTGSTSTLLKKELSTKLSGRYFSVTVYPLSFSEYLEFNDIKKPTTVERLQHFNEYMEFGAYPRVVLEDDNELKQEILKNYFQTIYLKDIIFPNNLRNNRDVFDLLYFIISNIAKLFSYSNIGKALGISPDTVKEYLQFAQDSYLVYTLTKFDHSVKRQLMNPKKIYCLDTGLVNSISFKFSHDRGRLLENLVYMTLNRQNHEIFYHKGRYECDFLIKDNLNVAGAVQVTYSLEDEMVKKREIRGLMEAMNAHDLKQGLILTERESGTMVIDDREIVIKSVCDWIDEMQGD